MFFFLNDVFFFVAVPEPQPIAFGSSQNRKIYPMHVPPTRFGAKMQTIKGQPNTGPGVYDNEQVPEFVSLICATTCENRIHEVGCRRKLS